MSVAESRLENREKIRRGSNALEPQRFPASPVTENEEKTGQKQSRVPPEVVAFIERLRLAEKIRNSEPGSERLRLAGVWWANLDESFRVYLLSSIGGPDWERYMAVRWSAFPEGLRTSISMRARVLERRLRNVPWA